MDGSINIEYLPDDGVYCAYCSTIPAIGTGTTKETALEDLREAAYLGIDCMVNEGIAGNPGEKNGQTP